MTTSNPSQSQPTVSIDEPDKIRVIVQPLSPGLITRGHLSAEEKQVRDRLFGRVATAFLGGVVLPLAMALPSLADGRFCHKRDYTCPGPCPQGTTPTMTLGGCRCR